MRCSILESECLQAMGTEDMQELEASKQKEPNYNRNLYGR